MNKNFSWIRFTIYFIVSFFFAYILWVGAQYLFVGRVNLDAVDILVTMTLAWYIARDINTIDNKLHYTEKAARQHC